MHFFDVTLLFEQLIIFKNLHFILLFLNIWTLTFYCFRLKNAFYLFLGFRVSNHCWAFQCLFWLSKLPSNHSATVTTLLYAIISIFDSKICKKKKISTISNLLKRAIYKTRYKYFRSDIIYVQNWRVCELLKCILAIQKQLTASNSKSDRPQMKIWDTWNI